MVITYKGENYFSVQSGETSILIDPNNQRSYKGTLLVLNTVKPAFAEAPEEGVPFFIDRQGEYEVSGVRVRGVSTGYRDYEGQKREHTAYRVFFDEIALGVLGFFSGSLDSDVVEQLAGCDILFIPAGNPQLLIPPEAAKIVRQIEPALVIPSFEKNLAMFAKEMDADLNFEDRVTVKKKDLVSKASFVRFLKA